MNTENLHRRLQEMRSRRSVMEGVWQDIVSYVMPWRADVWWTPDSARSERRVCFDSTAPHALTLLASGLHGTLTSPALPWFSLRMRRLELNDSSVVVEWLQEVEKKLYMVLNNSNFATEINELYQDLVGFGTGCLYVGEHPDMMIYFDAIELRQVYIAEDAYGQIDTVFREIDMTARQMVQRWGRSVSSEVSSDAVERPDKFHRVIHAVYPRGDADPGRRVAKDLPVASVYYEDKTRHVLSVGGYHEMPYMVPRWSVSSGEVYGRGPSHVALADVKLLNKIVETTIRAAQKKVDPPLLLSHDSFIAPIRITPSGINFVRGDDVGGKIASFPMEGDVGLGLEMEEQKRLAIRNMFFNDMMQLLTEHEMTATEVMRRTEERMRILGPVMGRLHAELLKPLIDRLFGICWRGGILPPPPQGIAGEDIDIEYVSPLAKAQKAADSSSVMLFLSLVAQAAQMDPSLMQILDGEEMLRYLAQIHSIPEKIIRSPEEMEQIRQAQAQMEQAQQAQEVLGNISQASARFAKGAEPGSVLEQVISVAGEGEGEDELV